MAECAARPSMEQLIEGYYIVSVLDALHREGALQDLARGAAIAEVAAARGYDPGFLASLVEYVRLRSCVLDGPDGGLAPFDVHLLEQYVGGFGPCLAALGEVARNPAAGAAHVNRSRHAAAFAAADRELLDPDLLRLIDEIGADGIADVGCGTAGFMIEAARRRPAARCLGFDHSTEAIAAARRRIAAEGLDDRVSVLEADVLDVAGVIDAARRDWVQVVVAASVANAFFGPAQNAGIDRWFSALRAAFPDRILLLSDYYGELRGPGTASEARPRALLHDVAQLISGQGIPPRDLDTWRGILDRNGCTLIQAFEGEGGGLRRFILLLQL
jgi:SAM-dependent methyltransferase